MLFSTKKLKNHYVLAVHLHDDIGRSFSLHDVGGVGWVGGGFRGVKVAPKVAQ